MELFLFTTKTIFSCLVIFLFSVVVTWATRIYTLKKSILDIPNERSSHHIPTPRGGGIAIVFIFIFTLLALWSLSFIESSLVLTLTGGGLLVAFIGYYDDVYSIKAGWRILFHFIAANWAFYWLGGFPVLDLGVSKIALHGVGYLFAIIGIVGCINFYNFMDGIDGLAGSEGIFIGLGSGIALWIVGEYHTAIVLWFLASAIAGFTIWNWPPAKIFLGDVGSGFLGFIFAVLGLYTINKGFLPITFWWLLLAVFLCDTTFTLIYRIYQGKSWYSAHREHAYQHLIAYGANHKQVTLSIIIINYFILLPIAFAALYWPAQSLWFAGSSIIGLGLVWIFIKSRSIYLIRKN